MSLSRLPLGGHVVFDETNAVLATWYRTWMSCVTSPDCGEQIIETHLSRVVDGGISDRVLHTRGPAEWGDDPYARLLVGVGDQNSGLLKDGPTLVGVDSTDLSSRWSLSIDAEPLTALANGGFVVQTAEGSVLAIDASGSSTPLGLLPLSAPSQVAAGVWLGVGADGMLTALNAPSLVEASFSFLAQGGNRQRANAPRRATVATFVPASALREVPLYNATHLNSDLGSIVGVREATNLTLFDPLRATRQLFRDEIAKAQDLVGFIGHSIEYPLTAEHPEWFKTSIGLRLADGTIVKKMSPQFADPSLPYDALPSIESNAKVIFVGACRVGELFMSLWNIDDATTDRALIVPDGATVDTDLMAAARAYVRIVQSLAVQGKTVAQAVVDGNNRLAADGFELRFRVVGGGSVRIK